MSQDEDNTTEDLILHRQCPRYIIDFDLAKLPQMQTDFLIIGAGAAGLRAAIETGRRGNTLLITKGKLGESNTMHAQGGIAVAINVGDQVSYHVEDTLEAGDGLCDEAAVQIMVEEGIEQVDQLVSWGANFDKQDDKLVFTMEAAHRMRRIIHAKGDATGEETENVLLRKASEVENVKLMEHCFALDLLTLDGRCMGVLILDETKSSLFAVIARATILASGGLCQIYSHTTNPDVATGDGYSMAYRAGCEMTDMEFVQFHPTALCVHNAPGFLISEAVRGEGAILVNANGEQFMKRYHEQAELAPRDVVSRAVVAEMARTNTECVFLDLTRLDPSFIEQRFPTITERCSGYGIDISRELIPVQASAHFMMGGLRANMRSETNIRGLYACGEVACTGVHGANRLASNSLLESLVFSVRAASAAIENMDSELPATGLKIQYQRRRKGSQHMDLAEIRESVRNLMWEKVGIVRNAEMLEEALAYVKGCDMSQPTTRTGFELQNMLNLSSLLIDAALVRQESRGAHYRSDYPHRDDPQWRRHIAFKRTMDDDL